MSSSSSARWKGLYVYLVSGLLGAFGVVELVGSGRHVIEGSNADPILVFISERGAVELAAWVQIATAAVAFIPIKIRVRLAAILLVGVGFGCYRLSRLVSQVPEACKCLSEVARLLGLGKTETSLLSIVVILALIIPSWLFLFACTKPRQAGSAS